MMVLLDMLTVLLLQSDFPGSCIGSEGNLLLQMQHYLRKISPDGITSTLAGLGPDEFGVIHDGLHFHLLCIIHQDCGRQ